MLADLPANSERDLSPWFAEVADEKTIMEAGIRIIGVAPLISEPSAAVAVSEWMEHMGSRADYLACLHRKSYKVIAPRVEDEFSDWRNVDTEGLNVKVIEIPFLVEHAMNQFMVAGLLPHKISKEMQFLPLRRLQNSCAAVHLQLDKELVFDLSEEPQSEVVISDSK